MTRRFLFLIFFIPLVTFGQQKHTVLSIPDSARPFTLGNFYALIVNNHPTAKQASLLSEVAKQEIRLARGNFDPKLEAQIASKKMSGKTYYNLVNGSLKFPTIFPIDPTIGIERNTGAYLNPEDLTGDASGYNQLYAGISIPLGRGLITDERRTALRQAELFKDMAEAEQVKIINKLLLDAAKQYWSWFYSYQNYLLMDKNVAIADNVYSRVKTNFQFGEASAVDTVQAKITLQQRQIDLQQSLLDFRNSGLNLSNMLWDSVSNPLSLDLSWIPVLDTDTLEVTDSTLKTLTDHAVVNHPELVKLDVKTRQLETEKRLAKEYLKPQLNLKYLALNQPLTPEGDFRYVVGDNYKFGVDFSFPLFLRKERSKLALTNVKLSNNWYEQARTEREITNSVLMSYNQIRTLQSMISNQYSMVQGYERILDAELLNLDQGESDLFKINIQQEKLIQAQSKWLKLVADYEKEKAQLYWAAGTNRLTL